MDSIMKRSLTKECKSKVKSCLLQGWVKRFDILEMLVFIITGVIQCVLENELAGYKVDVESVVHVIGEIVETSKTELKYLLMK